MIKQTDFYILIFLMLSASGCKQKIPAAHGIGERENTTEIRGKLQDGATESILLEEMGAREYIPVDTVKCDDSGNFSISFMQKQVAFYVLRYGVSGYITLLIEPDRKSVV